MRGGLAPTSLLEARRACRLGLAVPTARTHVPSVHTGLHFRKRESTAMTVLIADAIACGFLWNE